MDALFGVLQGLKSGVEHLIAEARADLLIVHSRVGFFSASLPLGMLEQIQSVPGVKVVDPVELFGGVYQKPTQQVGIVAIRPDEGWLSAFTFTVAPGDVAAFRKIRTGALVGAELVRGAVTAGGDGYLRASVLPSLPEGRRLQLIAPPPGPANR